MSWEFVNIEVTVGHDRVIAKAKIHDTERRRSHNTPSVMVSIATPDELEKATLEAVSSILRIAGLVT